MSFTAIFAVTLVSGAFADIDGSLDIVDASQADDVFLMTLQDPVKEFNARDAPDIVTFWAWSIPTTGDEDLRVVAITLHHGVNDHQAFEMSARSTPVQSFHPHIAEFTAIDVDDNPDTDPVLCVTKLESPALNFRVHNQETISVNLDETWGEFAATGTIGGVEGCPVELGITSVISTT